MPQLTFFLFLAPQGLIALDPRWIGAWWLGFLIISVSLIIPALLVAFCAEQRRNSRTPPGANDQSLMRARVGGENYGKWNGTWRYVFSIKLSSYSFSILGIIGSVFRVCRPPIFVALLLALTFDALALKGYFDFLPKFHENNYSPSILKSGEWLFESSYYLELKPFCFSASILDLLNRYYTGRNRISIGETGWSKSGVLHAWLRFIGRHLLVGAESFRIQLQQRGSSTSVGWIVSTTFLNFFILVFKSSIF